MGNSLAMYTATESDHVERGERERERERERMLVNKY
jgi:hypothetical protein